MKAPRWMGRLPGLTRSRRAQVLHALGPAVGLDRVIEARKFKQESFCQIEN